MNHLAHLLLSDADSMVRAGNLMGDFVRGRLEQRFPPRLEHGLRLHRRIDAFTDRHPAVQHSRGRFQPPFRRYAGILVDVYYDHLLARHWDDYVDQPLADFCREVYADLGRERRHMPAPLQRYVEHMQRYDLLGGYRERDGVTRALGAIGRRLRRANPLAEAAAVLMTMEAGLTADFRRFFPALVDQACRSMQWPPPLRLEDREGDRNELGNTCGKL